MDEVIGRLVANVGIDRAAAEKAVGIILDLPAKEGPPDKVQSYLAKLLGADAPRQKAASEEAGGVTGAVMRMMGASPSMGKVQSVSHNSTPVHVKGLARTRSAGSSPSPASRSLFECGH